MDRLIPHWPAPANVKAFTSTRSFHGVSQPPFDRFNLALHVGDDPQRVRQNRELLLEHFSLPSAPLWLNQTHSTRCIHAEDMTDNDADAIITSRADTVLAIMTADCVPVIVCDSEGGEIAAIHAGWRGLVNGIVSNTLAQMQSSTDKLMAWIGPAICGKCYEVGDEVYQTCRQHYPFAPEAFTRRNNKWLADLPLLAEKVLSHHGVSRIYHANACTFEQKNDFFSYRREPETGRIATFIWFK